MKQPTRKTTRLPEYDYSQPGYYFITVCTAVRGRDVLCSIKPASENPVGVASLGDPPMITLTPTGQTVQNLIHNMDRVYSNIHVDISVIMPDHIHLIIAIEHPENGSPRAATPTVSIPDVINTLKGLASKRSGNKHLWQRGYYDHILRNDADLHETRQYIQNNPLKWISEKD